MYLLHGADLLHTWEHTEFPGVFIYLFIFNFGVNTPFIYLFLNILCRKKANESSC